MAYYTIKEAEKALGIPRMRLRKYITELKLKLVKRKYRSNNVYSCDVGRSAAKKEWGSLIIASTLDEGQIEAIREYMGKVGIVKKGRKKKGEII